MMHDLQTRLRWEKRLRFKLRSWFTGCAISPCGDNEFFRKPIRSNGMFYQQLVDDFMQEASAKEV